MAEVRVRGGYGPSPALCVSPTSPVPSPRSAEPLCGPPVAPVDILPGRVNDPIELPPFVDRAVRAQG